MAQVLEFDKHYRTIRTPVSHKVSKSGEQVKIDIDCGDSVLTWNLTRRQASTLIKTLRRAAFLDEESTVEQVFAQPRRRKA